MAQDLESLKEVLGRVRDEVSRVIIGQRDVVDLALVGTKESKEVPADEAGPICVASVRD